MNKWQISMRVGGKESIEVQQVGWTLRIGRPGLWLWFLQNCPTIFSRETRAKPTKCWSLHFCGQATKENPWGQPLSSRRMLQADFSQNFGGDHNSNAYRGFTMRKMSRGGGSNSARAIACGLRPLWWFKLPISPPRRGTFSNVQKWEVHSRSHPGLG